MTAPIVAVVGPTASGKSDLGLALARALDGEIVNADAMQLYRGMDIGTAKLTPVERRGIAHHQLDVLEVTEEASVAAYQRASRADLAAIQGRGRRALLVGGSGLYVRAALDILEIPPTDPAVRARLEADAREVGGMELYCRLRTADPVAAQEILPTNTRRVIRALEVIEITGRPFSATMPRREYAAPAVAVGLRPERTWLDERIERRARMMFEGGLLDEVRALEPLGLRRGRTASTAIGYSQALAVIDGEIDVDTAVDQTATATRKLARRQESWFRPDPRITWLDPTVPDLVQRALAVVQAAAG
ncbi:MAG: tRNA (adenosine(37)-N6)-dimethylallyltransferase MiaA [Micrococcales bacterium]|nr:tRNA (adenosine(37)-N6)-dimethylallyltransferase MiaA [Micrococcales bacterium]